MGEVQEGEEVRSGLADPRRHRLVGDARARPRESGRRRPRCASAQAVQHHARLVSARDVHAAGSSSCRRSARPATMSNRVRYVPRGLLAIDGSDPHLMPDLAARHRRRREAMKQGLAIGAVLVVPSAALSVAGGRALRRDRGAQVGAARRAVVTRATFVDFLQLRGEIRPIRSIVLTAPSTGIGPADRRSLAKNGAERAAGDVVVDVRSHRCSSARSRPKQSGAEAGRVGDRADRGRAAARASPSAQSELDEAQKARAARAARRSGQRAARAHRGREASSSRCRTPKSTSASSSRKSRASGSRRGADVAIARQKRDKALYDVDETERIIGSLTSPRADRPDRSRCCRTSAPADLFARRAGIQARRSRLVRRADRGAARISRSVQMTARRRRSGPRRACRPAAPCVSASTRCRTAS